MRRIASGGSSTSGALPWSKRVNARVPDHTASRWYARNDQLMRPLQNDETGGRCSRKLCVVGSCPPALRPSSSPERPTLKQNSLPPGKSDLRRHGKRRRCWSVVRCSSSAPCAGLRLRRMGSSRRRQPDRRAQRGSTRRRRRRGRSCTPTRPRAGEARWTQKKTEAAAPIGCWQRGGGAPGTRQASRTGAGAPGGRSTPQRRGRSCRMIGRGWAQPLRRGHSQQMR
jgi:hypothetical protein